jgi:hypothetical protein
MASAYKECAGCGFWQSRQSYRSSWISQFQNSNLAHSCYFSSPSDTTVQNVPMYPFSSVYKLVSYPAWRSLVRVPMRSLDFSIYLILPAALLPWVRLNLQQKWVLGIFLGGQGRPARKSDNLTAICEPTVYKMWEPQRLTTLWASTACYKYAFYQLISNKEENTFSSPEAWWFLCQFT